ncbi:hypothetical protein DEU56DRAFT_910968 [Suillus clintonianus]|uniref:uncharacterized protein n=1 Tax=Suillus clintonianus TaxID=1904413 RepID=UPI001B8721E9|nr:uncharacterized protein DEU56DRAFT_910968 [Suillus clintonianus]KAG2143032.1 hypothetical protein DEU56DRAFT_910968 [Suillus clintonianus]
MTRDTFAIKVENFPENVKLKDVESMFTSTVGPVQRAEIHRDGTNTPYCVLCFLTHDAFKQDLKALRMSGYSIGGSSIIVTPANNNKMSSPNAGKNSDARRNLYVLGLPFDLTKAEFSALFSRFGTVMHAVILATVDNASRRRGFVVMSCHEEAKRAMNALSRTQMKGHTLDVSWAVVQRSQGFLDGADRTMMLASSNPSSLPEMELDHQPAPPTTSSPHYATKQWNISLAPSSKLLVSKLPTLLFAQASDLHPLFYPFGPIKEVKLMDSATLGNGTTSALVEYVNIFNAQEAKDALQRQFYGSSRLEVHFIQDNIHPVDSSAAAYAQSPMLPKTSDAGLNPFAAPFVFGSRRFPPLASGLSCVAHDSFVDDFYSPPGLPSDTFHIASFAPHPVTYHLKAHVADTISRSSSATSSR